DDRSGLPIFGLSQSCCCRHNKKKSCESFQSVPPLRSITNPYVLAGGHPNASCLRVARKAERNDTYAGEINQLTPVIDRRYRLSEAREASGMPPKDTLEES